MLEDRSVTCPYCWQSVALDIDTSAGSQAYTEDCSVCCRPMVIHLRVDEEGGFEVDAVSEDD